jgi:DNA-binding transcriptional LysR family regulator
MDDIHAPVAHRDPSGFPLAAGAPRSAVAARSARLARKKPPKIPLWNSWFLRARLRTRHLLLLSAIGEEGNICKAAEMLSMSQPAASRLLRELEEIIGTDLFERQARGVKANWYGEALIRHSRNALSSLTEAAAEIEALKSGRTGQVNVGSIAGPAGGLVPSAVLRVSLDYPLVRVQVIVDTSERLVQLLEEGKIDLMIGRLPVNRDSSPFKFDRLGTERVCAVVRMGHSLLGNKNLKLSQLADAAWIVPPVGMALRHRFEMMFRDAGLDCPKQLVETASPMVVTRLLGESDFVALLPCDVAEYYAGCGLIAELPMVLPCTVDPFGAITRKGCLLSPAAQLMCETLEDAAVHTQRTRQSSHPV